jgi:hypothetical protein
MVPKKKTKNRVLIISELVKIFNFFQFFSSKHLVGNKKGSIFALAFEKEA